MDTLLNSIVTIFLMVMIGLLFTILKMIKNHHSGHVDIDTMNGRESSPFATAGFVEIEDKNGNIRIESQKVFSDSYIKSLLKS